MNKKMETKSISSNVIQIEPDGIELKSVKMVPEVQHDNEVSELVSIDLTDQSCSSCASPKASVEPRESISITSSTDDDTEQAISLNINRKSNGIAYKGMMDIALLTANANQLRFLISYNSEEKTFYLSVTLVALSLIIQIAVGIGMIFKRRMKMKGNTTGAYKMSSFLLSGIFCLAVINVLVISFTTTTTTATTTATTTPIVKPSN